MKRNKIIGICILIMFVLFSGCSSNAYITSVIEGIFQVQIVGPNNQTMTVNSEGRADVVQHAHPRQFALHFHVEDLSAGTYRYILVDLDNNSIYNYSEGDYLHIESFEIQVDSDVNGEYTINQGFIEDVNANNGTRYILKHFDSSKTAGNQLIEFVNFYPNGWKLLSNKIITHGVSYEDINYNSTGLLPSSMSPNTPDTHSGSGDYILEIIVDAGNINVAFDSFLHIDNINETEGEG